MPAEPPVLAIEGLTKRFGSFEAVSDLSLSVAAGEIYAFLGPNGAGKTTTIKSVVGLLQPEAGRIRVSGAPVEPDALPFRRLLGYVADRPFLYEKLTGWEYLEFLAGVHRLSGWKERAEEYLHLFKLTEWRHQLIEGYSHGMRQKLVLTGALLHQPKLLIVDEPMVGLDPRSSRDVKELFGRLASAGTGLFLSTHSLETAPRSPTGSASFIAAGSWRRGPSPSSRRRPASPAVLSRRSSSRSPKKRAIRRCRAARLEKSSAASRRSGPRRRRGARPRPRGRPARSGGCPNPRGHGRGMQHGRHGGHPFRLLWEHLGRRSPPQALHPLFRIQSRPLRRPPDHGTHRRGGRGADPDGAAFLQARPVLRDDALQGVLHDCGPGEPRHRRHHPGGPHRGRPHPAGHRRHGPAPR